METKRIFELNSFSENAYEAEQIFRETCAWYENKFYPFDQTSSQAYQKYINNYHKVKSLYLIFEVSNNRKQLTIYDTESEREEAKILATPMDLLSITCITPLPNGELFCFCKFSKEEKALIIDNNYEVRFLLSGLPLFNLSAIYFNANIYCFGGIDKRWGSKAFSRKIDLNENRWIDLTPMPKADYYCQGAILNRDILICGYVNENLLLYSVDIDSYSIIPYKFSRQIIKTLINAERLYLIEFNGFIYESENENQFVWNKISDSIISNKYSYQICCVYNKGEIYIAVVGLEKGYFKFNLKQRSITKF